MMGVRWADRGGAEFQGVPFTQALIYGSWGGHFTFVEPMVTRAHLLTRPDTTATIATPAQFVQPGYHPTAYQVRYDPVGHEYHVAIINLTANQVSP